MPANDPPSQPTGRPPYQRWLLTAAKIAVTGLVIWFVWRSVDDSLDKLSSFSLRPDWELLILAGVVYLVGLAPMAWYWRGVLGELQQPRRWGQVLTAYYLGHLAKYVPGKATVLVVRVGVLRESPAADGPAKTGRITISLFLETLMLMAVGATITSLLLPTVAEEVVAGPWIEPLAIGFALLAVTPTLPPVLRLLAKRFALNDDNKSDEPPFSWKLFVRGWLAASITWVSMASSLGLTIKSLDADFDLTSESALRCLLAVTLPVVAGFLSFSPGGLLVRDGLMFALLSKLPGLAEPVALAATVLLRLLWIMCEAVACGILMVRRWRNR